MVKELFSLVSLLPINKPKNKKKRAVMKIMKRNDLFIVLIIIMYFLEKLDAFFY